MNHNLLHINASKSYVPYQDLENKQLLSGLLDSPQHFFNHLRRYASSLTTQMVFGFRTTSLDDPNLIQFFKGFDQLSELLGGASAALLDLYPVLRSLPDALLPARRQAKQIHETEKVLYVGYWMNAKRAIENGTAMVHTPFSKQQHLGISG
jgi:hypothetical protein